MAPSDIDENYIAKAKYLHITGITPALSTSCYQAIKEAIRIAKSKELQVVFDPNLREKLWPSKEKAQQVMLEIAAEADIILPGLSEATYLFGKKGPDQLAKCFLDLGAETVILKAGKEGTYYYTAEQSGFVESFSVEQVVDPVGAGDGFAAGFISGLLDELPLMKAVKRGNAVGAMVTMVNGDVEGLPEKDEIEHFIQPNKEDVSDNEEEIDLSVLQNIYENGLVGIIRGVQPDDILDVAKSLHQGGIHTLEITADTPRILQVIEQLREELPEEVIVGAGTVLDAETARAVIMAGAQFVFSPTVNIDMIQMTKRYGVVSIPGALTPTEILTAYEAGGDVIKVFPARSAGPNYIKDVNGPLSHIPLMPTGGINLDNIMDYFQAGAVAAGLGGSLVQAKKRNIPKQIYWN